MFVRYEGIIRSFRARNSGHKNEWYGEVYNQEFACVNMILNWWQAVTENDWKKKRERKACDRSREQDENEIGKMRSEVKSRRKNLKERISREYKWRKYRKSIQEQAYIWLKTKGYYGERFTLETQKETCLPITRSVITEEREWDKKKKHWKKYSVGD